MTEKELEETKKQVHTAALFLGGVSGIALLANKIVSFGWGLVIIAVVSVILDQVFKKIVDNYAEKQGIKKE